jgi:hypothetical protein
MASGQVARGSGPVSTSGSRVIRSESLPFVGDYRTFLDLPSHNHPALFQAVASLPAPLWNTPDVALPPAAIALDQQPIVIGGWAKMAEVLPDLRNRASGFKGRRQSRIVIEVVPVHFREP